MGLPEGVQVVRKPGRTYYYWAPGRNTARAQKRISLGTDPTAPTFWAKIHDLQGSAPKEGTWNALIRQYRASPDWDHLRPRSRADYANYLDRIADAAGDRLVAEMTKGDLYRWRARLKDTPATANHLISIIRSLLEFAVENDYRSDNPAVGMKRLKLDVDSTKPWPEEGWRYVMEHAPQDIRRMAILGRATGQRISDLVRMRPADRHLDGLSLRISKLRDREHFIPLTQAELAEIDGWRVGKMDLYFKTARGEPYTQSKMNGRWNRWRGQQRTLRGFEMKVHGLRATAVCDRRLAGMAHQEISNELCMSLQRVMTYSKYIDQEALARAGRDRRERSEVVHLKTTASSIENARGQNG